MFHVKHVVFLLSFLPLVSISQHMGVSAFEIKKMPNLPSTVPDLESYIDQFSSSASLSKKQREWFYWTNYSRDNPRRFWDSVIAPLLVTFPGLNNSYSKSLKADLYAASPLPLIKPNVNLARLSTGLAAELAAKNSGPSHTSPSGATFQDRMEAGSIKKCAGENISFGPDNPAFMLVLLYIDEGVPGLGHRKSLLNPAFVEMGVGIASYPGNKVMVIQDFACAQN